jgi:hypothetical protein
VSIDKYTEDMKTDPFEFKRQTGRTTRMMEAAKAVAESGKPVVVVFRDDHQAKYWREKYSNVAGMSIIHMRMSTPELDWAQMKFVTGPYAYHKTFLDHDVIYCWNKELFKAYVEYDRPLDHSPYITPQKAA